MSVRTYVLLVTTIIASSNALNIGAHQPLSRRRIIQQTAALALYATPFTARANDDALRERLADAQDRLKAAQLDLASGELGNVRQAVKTALTPLTMKGYLGDSVKARAQATGSTELAEARNKLLRNLGELDQYCYSQQTRAPWDKPLDSDVATAALEGAISSLDTVISKL